MAVSVFRRVQFSGTQYSTKELTTFACCAQASHVMLLYLVIRKTETATPWLLYNFSLVARCKGWQCCQMLKLLASVLWSSGHFEPCVHTIQKTSKLGLRIRSLPIFAIDQKWACSHILTLDELNRKVKEKHEWFRLYWTGSHMINHLVQSHVQLVSD